MSARYCHHLSPVCSSHSNTLVYKVWCHIHVTSEHTSESKSNIKLTAPSVQQVLSSQNNFLYDPHNWHGPTGTELISPERQRVLPPQTGNSKYAGKARAAGMLNCYPLPLRTQACGTAVSFAPVALGQSSHLNNEKANKTAQESNPLYKWRSQQGSQFLIQGQLAWVQFLILKHCAIHFITTVWVWHDC